MSVYDKIHNGDYETKLPYPLRPEMPASMRKHGASLTLSEIESLPKTIADYDAAVKANRAARSDRSADSARLERDFRVDIEAEFGMTGHPKADKLYALACEIGGPNGFESILGEYETLLDLVK